MRKPENFPKQCRLLTQADFARIRSKAKIFRTDNFNVYYKKMESERPTARLGISIPSKCCNAVLRSRIKRIIRESFRKQRLVLDSVDFVVAFHFRPTDIEEVGLKNIEKEISNDIKRFFVIIKKNNE